jgi:predicted metalloprotease with PDZ domain
LNQYAGKEFGDTFFNNYVYKSGMPDYKTLCQSVGVLLEQQEDEPYFGAYVSVKPDGTAVISNNSKIGSPAYLAGLDNGDVILNINDIVISADQNFGEYLKQFSIGESLTVNFTRFGVSKTTTLQLTPSPSYSFSLMEDKGQTPTEQMLQARKDWLKVE